MGTRWEADTHPSRFLISLLIAYRENLLAFMLLGDSAQTNKGDRPAASWAQIELCFRRSNSRGLPSGICLRFPAFALCFKFFTVYCYILWKGRAFLQRLLKRKNTRNGKASRRASSRVIGNKQHMGSLSLSYFPRFVPIHVDDSPLPFVTVSCCSNIDSYHAHFCFIYRGF